MNSLRILLVTTLLTWAGIARAAETSFQSGGKRITVEKFAPAGASQRTIIVLNGAGGSLLDGPEMRRKAQSLAAAGDTAYFVHYFNRTGSLVALDSTMQKNFNTWLETVKDAVTWAATESGKSKPVGIYGYSLGAFLAVAAASDNPRIGAVVEQAGGVWNNQNQRIGRMPPVLQVHGREDRRVPFAKYAEPLAEILRNRHALAGTLYLPGEGHVFTAAGNAQVSAKAAPFFAAHLK